MPAALFGVMSAEDNNSLEYDLVVTLLTLSDDWSRTVLTRVSLEAVVSVLETDLEAKLGAKFWAKPVESMVLTLVLTSCSSLLKQS